MSLKIIGAGKSVPEKRVSNKDLVGLIDTSDEWIFSRTGIRSRYVCTEETLTDLSASAALQAIQKASLDPNGIDLIICSTIMGDYRTPSLACCVSERIGAGCPAFDINAACSGFIYALEIASGYFSGGKTGNILIICAEMMSAHMDWNDRNTCVLFGDGAAACVVTSGAALRYIRLSATGNTSFISLATGTGNSPFVSRPRDSGFLKMQGQEVFRFAVNTVETEIRLALGSLDLSPGQIDWFILHQANKRIIDSARSKLNQPAEKFPENIDRYGNLSSVSVPLLLCEMLDADKIMPGDVIFMTAFGSGLTAGSCVMVWE